MGVYFKNWKIGEHFMEGGRLLRDTEIKVIGNIEFLRTAKCLTLCLLLMILYATLRKTVYQVLLS